MEKLKKYLKTIPPGTIDVPTELEFLLADWWNTLDDGIDDGSAMSGDKLPGRTENVVWDPPNLHFVIERHGAACLGSSRAELQHWTVDVEAGTVTLDKVGRRQLCAMSPRLNVKPLAEEICQLIAAGKKDEKLKWHTDSRVRVLTGNILLKGSAVKQTLEGRRKRFHKALEELLAKEGWVALGGGVYGTRDTAREEPTA